MTIRIIASIFLTLAVLLLFNSAIQAQANEKIEIMFVGFDHFSQLGDGTPASDVFSKKKQAEIAKLNEHLKGFSPDIIMVEVDPKEQHVIDSLYKLYRSGKLTFKDLENGSSETYQVGFKLGKQLKHDKIYGVDHYEAISQSLLNKGENIEVFQNGLKHLQQTARPKKKLVQQDSLSIYDYVLFMNKPEIIDMTHQLFYNLPALVVNGDFDEEGTNTLDLGKVDKEHIGAEYITLFYNRNLKIYSNILNTQMKSNKKRVLVLMGQTHVGVLQDLVEDNPSYNIVSPLTYLKAKK